MLPASLLGVRRALCTLSVEFAAPLYVGLTVVLAGRRLRWLTRQLSVVGAGMIAVGRWSYGQRGGGEDTSKQDESMPRRRLPEPVLGRL